ncbi:MAG TPA: ATP-dependent zinc metalloprotease FtsH [Atribacter sp.]|uniref:ATP-dependent zinc metalloprotease FtsH n=3 Tax=Atribacter TaxID=2847777 RepID=A0A1V5SUF0_9BACT|nr:ATP-dependent zinc metalloprotease FtsH [Atribacter sp.]OQA57883.1 MAG: ATP-dependent zinc metalloprotease FtsH [Candidatus Atribacteria bacterium ADurb.Bin276]HQK83062.1 ATP-dependent zinc metalloprotease FtsH [Atribacter sp.]
MKLNNTPGGKFYRNMGFYLLFLIIVVSLVTSFMQQEIPPQAFTYTEFIDLVKGNEVESVTIMDKNILGHLKDGTNFTTYAPEDPQLIEILRNQNVNIDAKPPTEPSWWSRILGSLLPTALLIIVWIFLLQQFQGGGSKVTSFSKSHARMVDSEKVKVTFDDVAGIEEVKEELSEVVDFLKNPRKFQKLGARIPRGVLLYGPPGTGKTLLAKAVAGEAGVPFFSISGSDFVEMFVGVGAARVRDLFGNAKRNAPCIIFVDELDAVGRHRGAGLGGGHDEREQTLNQLLVEMDGFDPNQGVILIAATNRPDILDPALLRPGRFDRRIAVPRPDVLGREAILKVHTKGKPLGKDIDLKILARRTPGFVGADLANMMNEAALLAARKGKDVIEMSDMEESIDKVIAGPERKNVIISDKEKKVVAYHESGHALVARFLPNTDPVHKISIIPRGGAALGYTLQLPTEDRYLISKQELMTRLAVLLGGRVAEEIVFEDITTGAHDDLQKATEIAREMVCEYGMSDTLGPLTLGRRHKEVFLGKDIAEDRNYSEEVAFTIDKEVRSIIDSAYEQARKLIIDNRDKLDKLTAILLEKEVLEREEIDKILDINGNEIPEFSSEEDKNKQAAAEQLLSDFPSNQEGRINTK